MESEFALKSPPLKLPRKFPKAVSNLVGNRCRVRSIGVYINAGSRQDTLETSGTANLLRKMLLRGTTSATKGQIAEELESMGAQLTGETGREISSLGLQVFKGDVSRAVSLLGEAITAATLDGAEVELAKQEQARENEDSSKDLMNTTIEACHFNAFRDHMMGQPIRGDPDNLQNLTADMLQAYRAANYVGDNIVIVGTGAVDHDALAEQVNQAFAALPKTATTEAANADKCVYVPALLMMRDDEMYNANVGVFYNAPSVKDEDYYSFLLMKHIIGNYRIDKVAEHLNDVGKQYNSMHALIGNLVDVTKADCSYHAYSDCGLWGNYFFGNEVFVRQMNYAGVCCPTFFASYVNEVEVVRGRNALWNSLMTTEDAKEINKEIGTQMLQVGRRVTRSEIAARVSHMDQNHIRHLCNEWFYDAEPSWTNWGPIENTSSIGSYKYFKVNTMTTYLNTHHSLAT